MTKEKKQRTFKEAAEAYRMKLHMEGRLVLDTERRIKAFEDDWGTVALDDVMPEDVQAYVYRKYQGKTASTVARNVTVFISILNNAYELGMLDKVPRIRRPRKPKDGRLYHLEIDEIMPVVEHVTKKYNALYGFVILLLVDTGLRFGEAMNLRWGDLGPSWITVRVGSYGNTKTKPRMIPTSPRLIEFMKQYLILPLATDKPTDLIVKSRWNERNVVIGSKLNRALRNGCFAIGTNCPASGFRLHDLRHTFAYQCAMAGADLGDIKDLMGHEQLDMTLRYRGFVRTKAADIIRKGMGVANGSGS